MQHIALNLGGRQFDERVAESFNLSVNVTFDDDVEFLERPEGLTAGNIIECQALRGAHTKFTLQLLALVGDFSSLLFSV